MMYADAKIQAIREDFAVRQGILSALGVPPLEDERRARDVIDVLGLIAALRTQTALV